MSIREHQPPVRDNIAVSEPIVFLAGPIQGAPLWQPEAVNMLGTLSNGHDIIHVANPRRSDTVQGDFDADKYRQQVAWEEMHLLGAADYGAIIFWFAKQDPEQPYEEGRAYAQTSRVEFGEVLGWRRYNSAVSIAMGIEPGYVGSEKYFRYKASQHELAIFDTLEDVCIEAVRGLVRG